MDRVARLNEELEGRYRIGRELGKGGTATVYLAEDIRHGRKVALKLLDHADVGESDARFRREIEIAARLSHPHILPLHDSGRIDGLPFYVMPYVAGESLRSRLEREKRLEVDEAVRLCSEIAEGLDYAHRQGIVHRDIKPANVMLHEGHALVADFGIASLAAQADEGRLTRSGAVVGTPAYFSPEQVNGEALDPRSDLYSLACVLFECLTGELPFSGSAVAMMAQRVMGDPPSVQLLRRDVQGGLAAVVQRAMARDPDHRFQTGRELISALRSPDRVAPIEPTRPSLVVIPFTNTSADPENEFFSDGLTEEIIAALSAVRGLSVISRTSAMRLKGSDKDVRTIGRELGVRYVLEGGVRKAGDRLRITAQLVDTASDEPVWAERYMGTIEDVFELQESVAREIVSALDVKLSSSEDRQLSQRPHPSVRGYELFLRARQEMRRYGPGIERGLGLVDEARRIAGDSIPLRVLASTAKIEMIRSGAAPDRSGLDEAAATARAILEEDPRGAYVLGQELLGFVAYERGDMLQAITRFRAATRREPNDVDMLFYIGVSYIGVGMHDESFEVARRLVECDPLSPMSWLLSTAVTWFVGRAAEGLSAAQRAVELDPNHLIVRWARGYTNCILGRPVDAVQDAEAIASIAPGVFYGRQLAALIAAQEGRPEEALTHVEGIIGLDHHHQFHLAEPLAAAGAADRAIDLLDAAVKSFHPPFYLESHCPFFEPLRGEPRFEAIVRTARENSAALTARLTVGSGDHDEP